MKLSLPKALSELQTGAPGAKRRALPGAGLARPPKQDSRAKRATREYRTRTNPWRLWGHLRRPPKSAPQNLVKISPRRTKGAPWGRPTNNFWTRCPRYRKTTKLYEVGPWTPHPPKIGRGRSSNFGLSGLARSWRLLGPEMYMLHMFLFVLFSVF